AINTFESFRGGHGREFTEVPVHETDPSPKRSQFRARELKCLAVLVDAEQAAILPHCLCNRSTMATKTGCAVDVPAPAPHAQVPDCLFQQNRQMNGGNCHNNHVTLPFPFLPCGRSSGPHPKPRTSPPRRRRRHPS